MIVTLLGVRGSLPTPLKNEEYWKKIRLIVERAARERISETQVEDFISALPHDLRFVTGGETTCCTVELEGLQFPVIIDCGTALRSLGDELLKGPCGQGKGELHIMITHTHWDHIQGLPFFKPAYIPGNKLHFYSPLEDLQDRLIYQQTERFFPMPFMATASEKHFHTLTAPFELGGATVDYRALKHPGGCFAYRFKTKGRTFIFATDAEFTGSDLELGGDSPYQDFFQDADLVVLDAQYTLDESFTKFDWGHTSYTMAVNCAARWKVKHLALTHHEPAYSDEKILENYNNAVEHRDLLKTEFPEVHLAREGLTFRLAE